MCIRDRYTIQLYCDFSGTMDVALGMGRVFNVTLPENFRQPFFSRTASEFWQRWHITLGLWFKDYVYYPISLSKPCKMLTTCLLYTSPSIPKRTGYARSTKERLARKSFPVGRHHCFPLS